MEELYQYDPRNRLTAYTKGGVTTMFQYDHAGNLLADDKARYSYDAFNRTEKVETFDGHIQLNRYDAEGLRYEMEENGRLVQFIYNQNLEVVIENSSNNINRLIRDSELIAANSSADSARTYYHYASDEMGSTTHIVDEDGTVKNRYEYDAWGNITAQEEVVPNRFKFTGQQFDPVTQQYYLRARFYNPVVARFTQEDTYRGDGLNLYAYCVNNPTYYTDLTGHQPKCVKDMAQKLMQDNPNLSPEEAYRQAYAKHAVDKLNGDSTLSARERYEIESRVRRLVADKLPEFDGKHTAGVMIDSNGVMYSLRSGGAEASYRNYSSAGHVEGKAAVLMRMNGETSAIVVHNNTNGTCGFCNSQIPTLLPTDAKLTVMPPSNAVANNKWAVASPKTYVGNANSPKPPKPKKSKKTN